MIIYKSYFQRTIALQTFKTKYKALVFAQLQSTQQHRPIILVRFCFQRTTIVFIFFGELASKNVSVYVVYRRIFFCLKNRLKISDEQVGVFYCTLHVHSPGTANRVRGRFQKYNENNGGGSIIILRRRRWAARFYVLALTGAPRIHVAQRGRTHCALAVRFHSWCRRRRRHHRRSRRCRPMHPQYGLYSRHARDPPNTGTTTVVPGTLLYVLSRVHVHRTVLRPR